MRDTAIRAQAAEVSLSVSQQVSQPVVPVSLDSTPPQLAEQIQSEQSFATWQYRDPTSSFSSRSSSNSTRQDSVSDPETTHPSVNMCTIYDSEDEHTEDSDHPVQMFDRVEGEHQESRAQSVNGDTAGENRSDEARPKKAPRVIPDYRYSGHFPWEQIPREDLPDYDSESEDPDENSGDTGKVTSSSTNWPRRQPTTDRSPSPGTESEYVPSCTLTCTECKNEVIIDHPSHRVWCDTCGAKTLQDLKHSDDDVMISEANAIPTGMAVDCSNLQETQTCTLICTECENEIVTDHPTLVNLTLTTSTTRRWCNECGEPTLHGLARDTRPIVIPDPPRHPPMSTYPNRTLTSEDVRRSLHHFSQLIRYSSRKDAVRSLLREEVQSKDLHEIL